MLVANREVCILDFRFFLSIVQHASTQSSTPAPRGIASQHLRTFERVLVNKELLTGTVPFNKKLFTGSVLVNNLFFCDHQLLLQNTMILIILGPKCKEEVEN